ncbi:MAG: hypothetical protein WCI67_08080 [Chloroflexales bacterium]
MELIIAMVLFIALVACWILLPGQAESKTYALHTTEALPSSAAHRTVA